MNWPKMLAAVVGGLLAILTVGLSVAEPASGEPMPSLAGQVVYEDTVDCGPVLVRYEEYDTTADDQWIGARVFYIGDESRPFYVVVWDRDDDETADRTQYLDRNRDGVVDVSARAGVDDPALDHCQMAVYLSLTR